MNANKQAALIYCPVCGHTTKWVPAEEDANPPFGGWYCKPCDVFAETDVELDD